MSTEQLQRLEMRLAREKMARQEAERLLEAKSLELYTANCELADAARTLEAKVEARTRELAAALALAEAGMRAKTEFLAVMSHELRTPMNGVLGMAELLAGSTLSAAQHELLAALQRSATDLMALIADVLDLSALDQQQLVLKQQPIDMGGLIDMVAAQVRAQANAKGLSLWLERPDSLPWMLGDAERVRQIMLNLLSNALKFTEYGEICIEVRVEKRGDGQADWQFAVRDSGVGMTPEEQSHLFHTFEMVDRSTTRRHGGTGLGLALSQRLAHAMQGRISAESEAGVGSCFLFHWQAAIAVPPPVRASDESLQLPAVAQALRVLVAEDNVVNQKLIVRMLEKLGIHQIRLACDGLEAVQAVAGDDVDLILMDMQMPNMDGPQATRTIRSQDRPVQPDIVALTANAFDEDRELCLACGMDDFLAKPIKLERLASALCQSALGRYNLQRQQKWAGAAPGAM